MVTRDLIEKYLQHICKYDNYKDLTLKGFYLDVFITIRYTYKDEEDTLVDNRVDIDLLDYITFIFNCK